MNKLVHPWRTWCSFTSPERIQWLQTWLFLPLVALVLRAFGLRRVQALLDRLTLQTPGQVDLPAAEALARIFYSAVRRSFFSYSCLEQSLVLQCLLHRQGLAAELRIGVAKPDGRLAAHAWVEHDGMALEQNKAHRHFIAFDEVITSIPGQTG